MSDNPPPLLTGDTVRRTVDAAMADLKARTAAHDPLVNFSKSTWDINQDTGQITFTRPDGQRTAADVQIIGTYNTFDGTWFWAWEHPSVDAALARHASAVRQLGQKHAIEPLTTRKLTCSEQDCWEFTALACKLNGAQGGYRASVGPTLIFTTFGKLKMAAR